MDLKAPNPRATEIGKLKGASAIFEIIAIANLKSNKRSLVLKHGVNSPKESLPLTVPRACSVDLFLVLFIPLYP
jgi:hypothetical protein